MSANTGDCKDGRIHLRCNLVNCGFYLRNFFVQLADESNRVFQLHRLSRHFRANGDPCGYLDFRGFRLGITTFRGGAKSLSEFFSIGVCDIACTRIVTRQIPSLKISRYGMVCCAVCGPAFFGWACFLGLRSGRFLSSPGLAALVVVCNRRFLLVL